MPSNATKWSLVTGTCELREGFEAFGVMTLCFLGRNGGWNSVEVEGQALKKIFTREGAERTNARGIVPAQVPRPRQANEVGHDQDQDMCGLDAILVPCPARPPHGNSTHATCAAAAAQNSRQPRRHRFQRRSATSAAGTRHQPEQHVLGGQRGARVARLCARGPGVRRVDDEHAREHVREGPQAAHRLRGEGERRLAPARSHGVNFTV
eukprot:366328-Chlamydomonas_euryale.AAC.4